ncbi:MAG: addiction module protein [Deltaproteobacteria bacterium]|nr:addiction module protein [Deltaproteobacteria bacterium]
MANAVRQIESKALKLSAVERARLAERLISSLDEEPDADAEAQWVLEAERRLEELHTGKVRGRPAANVFRKARSAAFTRATV